MKDLTGNTAVAVISRSSTFVQFVCVVLCIGTWGPALGFGIPVRCEVANANRMARFMADGNRFNKDFV